MPETARQVIVRAPSRLHVGLLSFGRPGVRQFGGAGIMIDAPGVKLRISPHSRLQTAGPLRDRAEQFARRFAQSPLAGVGNDDKFSHNLPCRIDVLSAGRQHTGLGVGTQLGMAVAAGLHAFLNPNSHVQISPDDLARAVRRGSRSAVGVHGFRHGGLIVESGKRDADEISPLAAHVKLPAAWRFVLFCPREVSGRHGDDEMRAFDDVPAVPEEITQRLCGELLLGLIPSARRGELDEFGDSLERFGRLAGSCFSSIQGGIFSSPQTAALADRIRSRGGRGVAQSSWGPTLFALAADQAAAERLARPFGGEVENGGIDVVIARPNNGASIQVQ